MLRKKFYYLIRIQFCGFRYHGWQKQSDVKTVQYMLDRTIRFILDHDDFKTLGAGRTDAMVSAHDYVCELFVYEKLDCQTLLEKLNISLPADIKALAVNETDNTFNIIKDIQSKEYHYYFSCGVKPHPFSAPFLSHYQGKLDITKMSQAAKLFIGEHNFKRYCHRAKNDLDYTRTIISCEIIKNHFFQGDFFPKNSYVLKVTGKGFVRHQVRLIMGTLIRVGREQICEDDIIDSFIDTEGESLGFIAPASGLHLYKIIL